MIEIRSYRRVFDLERRIYSVDRLRLNPGGVPVRGVVYFLAILLAGTAGGGPAAARRRSRGASVVSARPRAAGLRGAAVLSAIRIEGRTFHLAAHALLRYRVGPRGSPACGGCARRGARCGARSEIAGASRRLGRPPAPPALHGSGGGAGRVEHERGGRVVERRRQRDGAPGLRASDAHAQPADAAAPLERGAGDLARRRARGWRRRRQRAQRSR